MHDPRIVQILTAPKSHLTRGEFGLKAAIGPAVQAAKAGKVGEIRYVQARDQDAQKGLSGLEWKEREGEVLLLKMWQETNGRIVTEEERDEAVGSGYTDYTDSSSAQKKMTAVNQPRPSSRFDRNSRPKFSLQQGTKQGASGQVPNYLLYSDEQFQQLLETVREKRQEFIKDQVPLVAEAQRQSKYNQALRSWREQGEQTRRPELEDFPLQVEIDSITASRPSVPSNKQGTDLSDPTDTTESQQSVMADMYDLSRLSHTTISSAAYLRQMLSKLDMVDPKSTTMPYQQLQVSSASASFLQNNHGLANAASGHHTLRGLQYSQPDDVFAQKMTAPLPARVIVNPSGPGRAASSRFDGGRGSAGAYLVATGSRVAKAPIRLARDVGVYDPTGRNLLQGTELVRLAEPSILSRNSPTVQRVDRRIAGRKAAWDKSDEAFAALDLGYINSTVRTVIREEANKNAVAAENMSSTSSSSPSSLPPPGAYLPGSPHWVGFDPQSRARASLTSRRSFLDRARDNSPAGQQRLNATGGMGRAFGGDAEGKGNESNKVLLGKDRAAERRRATYFGLSRQQQQQQGDEKQPTDGSRKRERGTISPSLSSLLFDQADK